MSASFAGLAELVDASILNIDDKCIGGLRRHILGSRPKSFMINVAISQ